MPCSAACVVTRTLTGLASIRYPYLEVVVVDDGSTDDTLQALCDFSAAWPPVRIVTQPNRGKAAALNTGFVTARGEIVVTLDADEIAAAVTGAAPEAAAGSSG